MSDKPKALTSPVLENLQAEFKTIADIYQNKVLKELETASMMKLKYEGVLEYLENKSKAELKRLQDAEAKKLAEAKKAADGK